MNHAHVCAEALVEAYLLRRRRPLFLGVRFNSLRETGEILEAAILDSDGTLLLHSLFRPSQEISDSVFKAYRIPRQVWAQAPNWEHRIPELQMLLGDRLVVTYYGERTLRLLRQTNMLHGVAWDFDERNLHSLQEVYARYCDAWDDSRAAYRRQPLGFAIGKCAIGLPIERRALSQAQCTRALLDHMAEVCARMADLLAPPPARHPRFYAFLERRARAL